MHMYDVVRRFPLLFSPTADYKDGCHRQQRQCIDHSFTLDKAIVYPFQMKIFSLSHHHGGHLGGMTSDRYSHGRTGTALESMPPFSQRPQALVRSFVDGGLFVVVVVAVGVARGPGVSFNLAL
jgi:hypothetical protein